MPIFLAVTSLSTRVSQSTAVQILGGKDMDDVPLTGKRRIPYIPSDSQAEDIVINADVHSALPVFTDDITMAVVTSSGVEGQIVLTNKPPFHDADMAAQISGSSYNLPRPFLGSASLLSAPTLSAEHGKCLLRALIPVSSLVLIGISLQ